MRLWAFLCFDALHADPLNWFFPFGLLSTTGVGSFCDFGHFLPAS
jgi:hypothetical protein